MSGMTYYQRNRDVILNKAKIYFENNKERLRDQAKDKYRNLSEKNKSKKKRIWKKTDIICLKKTPKTKRISKNYREAKSPNIKMSK